MFMYVLGPILILVDHFDARNRDDQVGVALEAQVTLLHVLQRDGLEGETFGGGVLAAGLRLKSFGLVGRAVVTLRGDLGPFLFLRTAAELLHQQEVVGPGPLVEVNEDLLVTGVTHTHMKHTTTLTRTTREPQNQKAFFSKAHQTVGTLKRNFQFAVQPPALEPHQSGHGVATPISSCLSRIGESRS